MEMSCCEFFVGCFFVLRFSYSLWFWVGMVDEKTSSWAGDFVYFARAEWAQDFWIFVLFLVWNIFCSEGASLIGIFGGGLVVLGLAG